jgi:hypothetical protein
MLRGCRPHSFGGDCCCCCCCSGTGWLLWTRTLQRYQYSMRLSSLSFVCFPKKAYTSSNISVTTTTRRDTFEVSTNRQERSKCPNRFPASNSYKWETDKLFDLKCPVRASVHLCVSRQHRQQTKPGDFTHAWHSFLWPP